jgi:hypothetical protein
MNVSDKGLNQELLEVAAETVRAVPFVRDVEQRHIEDEIVWRVRTVDGEAHSLRLVAVRSKRERGPDTLLIADRLPKTAAATMTQEHLNYVDRAGNLNLVLSAHYYAHVEGKRTPRRLPAMRAPAYRVLLAWLIDPHLISGSLRTTTSAASVSRTAVQDMRTRLAEWDYVVGTQRSRVWTARGRKEALRMWLEGYRTTVRSSLDLGGFRLKEGGPQASNLTHVRRVLADEWAKQSTGHRIPPWRWGGTEALRHIAGTENYFIEGGPGVEVPVVSLAIAPSVEDVSAILPIVRSEIYNIRLHRLPIAAATKHDGLDGWPPSVPHPLMVWSELMCSSEPRVREAAEELSNTLPPGWL